MTAQQINEAIAAFERNLSHSLCMGDRRNSVRWLADKIGSNAANLIAEVYGLRDSYYKA